MGRVRDRETGAREVWRRCREEPSLRQIFLGPFASHRPLSPSTFLPSPILQLFALDHHPHP